jgi:CheY-like chemotaxis protein
MNRSIHVQSVERPNTIGLPSNRLSALLDLLDQPSDGAGAVNRHFSRWPFRQVTIHVQVTHPGGNTVSLRLACRNLSRGGIGLLHTSYIHPGSLCNVELPTLSGQRDRVEGVAQRCSHRRGTLHEIGIRFRKSIDLSRYVFRDQSAWVPSVEHVDHGKLAGTLLCVEPSESDLDEFRAAIRDTSLRLRHVGTGAQALAQPFAELCAVIANVHLPDMSGMELLAKIRSAGARLPVILLGEGHRNASRPNVDDPAALALPKHVAPEVILRAIAEWLPPIEIGATRGVR